MMIGISKLYCGTVEPSDVLRYGRQSSLLPSHLLQFARDPKPVVVWNVGQRCNLRCAHCYSHSGERPGEGELTDQEGSELLRDLSAFGVPVVLFSGGEPLLRPSLPDWIEQACGLGMRAVLSTNGTLMTAALATRLKAAGLSYAGISLDGIGQTHDQFRGIQGAFDLALQGVHLCMEAGVKVGLRFTVSQRNVQDISAVFDLIEAEGIPRICFYHLVYTGRGTGMAAEALSHDATRAVVDLIMERTLDLHERGCRVEVLTVDNHCDGPYVYMRLLKERNPCAAQVLELLRMNGGNRSGEAIGCISWDGTVYADQFWRHLPLGNVRETPFSRIWTDPEHSRLSLLRDRKSHLNRRCAGCRWLDVCNGNLRVRAEALTGDVWALDPACYLTDAEIAAE